MYTYRYRATNPNGVEEKGKIVAEDELDAIEMLQLDNLYVVEMKKLSFLESMDLNSITPVPMTEVEEFYRQASFLLQAGIPLESALKNLAKQIKHRRFKEAILKIAKGLSEGVKFSEGLSLYPRIFPPVATSMIKVAEENGDYDKTFMNLADYFKRLREMRSKLLGALGYPIFIFIFAIGVSFFLSTSIIPQVAGNLSDAGGELPAITQFVVNASENFVPIFIGFLIIAGVVGFAWWYIQRNADLKFIVDRFFLKMPILGEVITEIQQSRFCDSMSTLLTGGVPVAGAINLVGRNLSNEAMKRTILKAGEDLKQGKRLSVTLNESKLFTYSLILVTAIGEKTGKMDESFHMLAKKYEAETEKVLKRMVNIITPITIMLLAIMVGTVAMAMILAMNAMMRAY